MPTENPETFVLERTENPHPVMLAGAMAARTKARWYPYGYFAAYWEGYLAAMCAATGEPPQAIEAWMDRMEAKQ